MNPLWEELPEELRDNPFFHFTEANNFVPAWDKISMAHAGPAIEYMIDQMGFTVFQVASNPAKPTFKNTVEPIEDAFAQLSYFYRIFASLTPRNKDEEKIRDAVEKDLLRKWSDAATHVFAYVPLFERFVDLASEEKSKHWTAEQQAIAGMYYNSFIEFGIKLDPEKRKSYHKMQKQVSELGMKIQQRMRDAGDNVMLFVKDPLRLHGIPDDVVHQAAAQAEKSGHPGEWAFLANRSVFESVMRTAENRSLRKDMWELYHKKRMTGPYYTNSMIMEFAKVTHDAARLKSGKSPASEILRYNMAGDPKTVSRFLLQLRDAALPVAQHEMDVMAEFASQNLGIHKLKAWDLDFVSEKVKARTLGFTEESLREYFELENVLENGVFAFLGTFGIFLERKENYPLYHPDVRTYDVRTKSGRHMGVLMLDLYDRPGKMAGIAWSMSVLPQGMFLGKVRRPVNKIDLKVTKPQEDMPTLLTHDQVVTLMHEFAHSLHDLCSECVYQSRSGTGVATDFVEFPSQFYEYVGYNPEFLRGFAVHCVTGEPLPEETLQKIAESRKFMAGRSVLERAMRGWLDFQWHNRDPLAFTSVRAFEDKTLKLFRLPGIEYPTYSPSFSYTFGGGYDSSFYSYQWSQVMSDDLLAQFNRKGLYDKTLRKRFIKALANGGYVDEASNYRQITGRHPTLKPMLRAVGLAGRTFDYSAAFIDHGEAANDPGMLSPPEPKAA